MTRLRIGSRGSALALWQANFVRRELARLAGVESEIVVIRTSGDHFQNAEIARIGVKGVFIKEIEDALLAGRIDVAVHSMKDVPTETPNGLAFPAVCQRDDPRDCLLSRAGAGLMDLPPGARVGTGSLRRQAQLRRARPDLAFADLRGNVDTRLRKLDSGEYDAIVLAKAGLDRLGLSARITQVIEPGLCLPAVGQGAIAVETRADDETARGIVSKLDHAVTRAAVTAERALLSHLEGGCQVPLGALAREEHRQLVLDGCVVSPDGGEIIGGQASGRIEEAEAIGQRLGETLLEKGAARILQLAGRGVSRG